MDLADVIQKIKNTPHTKRPVLIAIEGFGGAGKSTTARKLKDTLGNAYIVQTDDFIIKDKLALVSPDMECYDLERLEKQVLAPLGRGEQASYQALDWTSNTLGKPIKIPQVDYVVVEGITAYFPSIAKYYDYKIWIDTPIDTAFKRGKANDAGTENEQHWELWSKNDVAYKQKYHPEKVADFIIGNG